MNFNQVLQNAKTAALIGSREPPERIAHIAVKIGRALSNRGIKAYSGGADGMDNQFMLDYSPERRAIIIPQNGFNGLFSNGRDIIDFTELDTHKAADIVKQVAGNYDSQPPSTQRKYSRNVCQVLTEKLDSKTDFVLFWAKEKNFCVQGGTAIAVRVARLYGIPSFNLWNDAVLSEVCDSLGIDITPRTLDMFL
ncbi:RNA ligase [Pantoea phage Phynn]|nr:RNA ligase [Pantoea phage Phynn]